MDPTVLPLPGPVQVLGVRLLAERVRSAGVRVRLLRGAPGRPGGLGGAVRRLRQRRPDGDRRVHLLCAAEVGTDLLGGPAPTARLRGSGTGPLLGPEGTLPAAGRRG